MGYKMMVVQVLTSSMGYIQDAGASMYVLPVAIGYVVERMLVKPGTLRHPADADISAPVTLEL